MRYLNIRDYQISVLFLMIIAVPIAVVLGATYYLWAQRTVIIELEEPLSITAIPSSVHFKPGENSTFTITIQNSATANYSVFLSFALNDTDYQTSYVQFSNTTYNIGPGANDIVAWAFVTTDAPAHWYEVAVTFYRQ